MEAAGSYGEGTIDSEALRRFEDRISGEWESVRQEYRQADDGGKAEMLRRVGAVFDDVSWVKGHEDAAENLAQFVIGRASDPFSRGWVVPIMKAAASRIFPERGRGNAPPALRSLFTADESLEQFELGEGKTFLSMAIERLTDDEVCRLLEGKLVLNSPDQHGVTPFHLAMRSGFERAAEAILKGAPSTAGRLDIDCLSAWDWGIRAGHEDLVVDLYVEFFDRERSEGFKWEYTALDVAVRDGEFRLALELIDEGMEFSEDMVSDTEDMVSDTEDIEPDALVRFITTLKEKKWNLDKEEIQSFLSEHRPSAEPFDLVSYQALQVLCRVGMATNPECVAEILKDSEAQYLTRNKVELLWYFKTSGGFPQVGGRTASARPILKTIIRATVGLVDKGLMTREEQLEILRLDMPPLDSAPSTENLRKQLAEGRFEGF